jgi:hypothetical protein
VERRARAALLPIMALTGAMVLGIGSVAAQDDDDEASMAPVAPMASMAPVAPMASFDPAALGPGLHVVNAWSRESPMMDLAGAAFMVIVNNTDADDALVSGSSPAAGIVEIHQTTQAEDGTMAMAPVEEVPVPAGGMAELKPGGYHVMLIDLVQPLVVGESIELTLDFATSGSQTVTVPVEALGPMAMGDDADDDTDDDSAMEAEESEAPEGEG